MKRRRKKTEDDLIPIPSGFLLRHTLSHHEEVIFQIVWSPTGKALASSGFDQTIIIWDMENGQLLRTLKGHTALIHGLAWSADGQVLASCSNDKTIRLWNVQTGQCLRILEGHSDFIRCVVWSVDGRRLFSCSDDQTIKIWDVQSGKTVKTLTGHSAWVTSLALSHEGVVLASGSGDGTIRLWNVETGQFMKALPGGSGVIYHLAWSPDKQVLVSCSFNNTIQIWDISTEREADILEGHVSSVNCVSFSCDGRLLASKSSDGTVRIWRTDTWEAVAILQEKSSDYKTWGLAFHPNDLILATLDEKDKGIRIWDLDFATLLKSNLTSSSVHYTNAKVVLVGDSGVGKSGLGLVLTGQPFKPTESTHGRRVWLFESREVKLDGGRRETRETLLWDLAGQPGYRLIHQLHLNEVAVALVIFDARSETDPFAGVHHWDRALQQARRIQSNSVPPMKKFLVGARIDRGGIGVSLGRIESLMRELGFEGYYETSAKEGKNIVELVGAIKDSIDWTVLPKVSSTKLFQQIKAFLISEKEAGRILSTTDDLYRTFLKSNSDLIETEELRAQFEACIGRVESRGLIRRLSFGNLILLQPELLDAYASALINAVKDEPDGLGSIPEEEARAGSFAVPNNERLKDKEQEKLLLIAMVEDLLRHEIVLREQAEDGPYLVFPSQSTRENPNLPDPDGKAVIFDFDGPVLNIYATLAVRLSHSGVFMKKETWKNAMTYTARLRGMCGMFLRNLGEGHGELTLFFDKMASEETRFYFVDYVQAHLRRRAISESIHRRLIFVCSSCGEPFTDSQVKHRRELGFNWISCNVCDKRISILDKDERLAGTNLSIIREMDRAADNRREREVIASILQGRKEIGDFDVFLCHNFKDKPEVKKIGNKLRELSILPWLDEWELRPGLPWQRMLEQQIEKIKSAAVFVGKDGIGPWQKMELEAYLREFIARDCPVIPVLLPNASKQPQLPIFLKGMTWVDFRKEEPNPLERLVWGITGKQDSTQL